jgi:Holliday junction resolvase
MGLKSYKVGEKFEKELCKFFANRNYYVIYNNKGVSGAQCFDMLIIRDNVCFAIECKNLENKNGIFNIDRVEENQLLAYKRFLECRNHNFVLAILWNDNVYIVNFDLLEYYKKSIDLKKIEPNIKNWSKVTNENND